MDDLAIIELYWARDERAIEETTQKYSSYCHSIAHNLLHNTADAEECVNDTWLNTWNSLPPQRPSILSAYLGTLTRNLSLTRYRAEHAKKRTGNRLAFSYEELQESVPNGCSAEDAVDLRELGKSINLFLSHLPEKDCCIFLRRYWYFDSIAAIAARYRMSQGTVKTRLYRIRLKLKSFLEQEGYSL